MELFNSLDEVDITSLNVDSLDLTLKGVPAKYSKNGKRYGRPLGKTSSGSKADFQNRINSFQSTNSSRSVKRLNCVGLADSDIQELGDDLKEEDVVSAAAIQKYYEEAKKMSPMETLEECLIVARFLLGKEAKKSEKDRDTELTLACTTVISRIVKQITSIEDSDRKVAEIVRRKLEATYREVSLVLSDELNSHPELFMRIMKRLIGVEEHPVLEAEIVG